MGTTNTSSTANVAVSLRNLGRDSDTVTMLL